MGDEEYEIIKENVGEMFLFSAEIERKSKKAREQIKGGSRSLSGTFK